MKTQVVNVNITVQEYRYGRYLWKKNGVWQSSRLAPSGYTSRYDYSDWLSAENRVECVYKTYNNDPTLVPTYRVGGITYYDEYSRSVTKTVQQTQYSYIIWK